MDQMGWTPALKLLAGAGLAACVLLICWDAWARHRERQKLKNRRLRQSTFFRNILHSYYKVRK